MVPFAQLRRHSTTVALPQCICWGVGETWVSLKGGVHHMQTSFLQLPAVKVGDLI